jgi:hypothetical protein
MNGVIPTDPWSLVSGQTAPGYRLAAPVPMPRVTPDPAPRAYERVLAGAGASLVRDSVDTRVVATVRGSTGRIIDSQKEVGGWPLLAAGVPWKDSDGDGMPDDWERRQRLNPNNPADGNADRDRDGYTELEEWMNALVEPRQAPAPKRTTRRR